MSENYPPVAFNFKVEFGIDGATGSSCSFNEVSGLDSEIDVEEIVEGGENRFKYKLPHRVKHPNLVLKRGLISDPAITRWVNDIVFADFSKPIVPIEIIVSLINENNQPVAIWKIESAYPVKFSVSEFKSTTNETAVETLELAYNNFTRTK